MLPKKKRKEKKMLLPTGASNSAAHTVLSLVIFEQALMFAKPLQYSYLFFPSLKLKPLFSFIVERLKTQKMIKQTLTYFSLFYILHWPVRVDCNLTLFRKAKVVASTIQIISSNSNTR
jgi:hypothetical protein